MNDENPSNDVQDPAEPHKVTEAVVTETTLPDSEQEAPPTETKVETVTETVTETPVTDGSSE